MSHKKQKSQGKVASKPQSDPWLKWCAPAQSAGVQRYFANPEERLGMSINDYLDCIEISNPFEILSSAQRTISDATKGINLPKLEEITIPHVLDVEDEDGTSLGNIPIFENVLTKRLTLFEIADKVFSKLEKLKAAWPHQDAVERVKNTAKEFVRFLLAVYKLEQEKITQAKALGCIETATKLEKAYKDFCIIELTGDIDTDAKRLFLERKITPDEFRVAMRRAFSLDRQATEKINQTEEGTFQPQPEQKKKRSPRYPKDKEALKVLEEAKRRYESDAYENYSLAEVISKMVNEDTNYTARILHGKLKGKDGGREQVKSQDREKAIETWGKYLSAYIVAHKNKG